MCQRNKGETISPPGLLNPLPLPEKIWEEVSMDFIEGLPKSQGKMAILVVDRYSKLAHFIPSQHPYTAPKDSTDIFLGIFHLYGLLKTSQ